MYLSYARGSSSDEDDFSSHIFTKNRSYGGEEELVKEIGRQKEEEEGEGYGRNYNVEYLVNDIIHGFFKIL